MSEIVTSVCNTLACLTDSALPTTYHASESFGVRRSTGANYTIGRIDAQIIACDVQKGTADGQN